MYINSRLWHLLSCHTTLKLAPSKENVLCGHIQNHGWFCEQCFMRTLHVNQGCQIKAVGLEVNFIKTIYFIGKIKLMSCIIKVSQKLLEKN